MAQSARVRRLSTPLYLAILALVLVPLAALALLGGSTGRPTASTSGLPTDGIGATDTPGSGQSGDGSEPTASPGGSGVPATPPPVADVAIVPVVDFRSTATGIDGDDVRAVLAGSDRHWKRL